MVEEDSEEEPVEVGRWATELERVVLLPSPHTAPLGANEDEAGIGPLTPEAPSPEETGGNLRHTSEAREVTMHRSITQVRSSC